MRHVILGDDDQPAGFLVEPVHNSRAQLAAHIRQFAEAMQQRVDQRPAIAFVLGGACSGVHHHSRWLVDDSQVVIFIDDVERDVLCDGAQRRGLGVAKDGDLFAAAQPKRRLGTLPLTRAFCSASNCCTRARLMSGMCAVRN